MSKKEDGWAWAVDSLGEFLNEQARKQKLERPEIKEELWCRDCVVKWQSSINVLSRHYVHACKCDRCGYIAHLAKVMRKEN